MPGSVIKVKRRDRLGWAERFYLPTIFVGLKVTTEHFFRNLWGYIVGRPKTFVVQYPEEQLDYEDAFRGQPVLVALESGKPKCVACGLCEFACPPDAINIVPGPSEDGIEREPASFDIDFSRCMFCGLCEEACPEEAIVMSREVEMATLDRGSLVHDMKQLLRTEEQLARRIGFIEGGYERP